MHGYWHRNLHPVRRQWRGVLSERNLWWRRVLRGHYLRGLGEHLPDCGRHLCGGIVWDLRRGGPGMLHRQHLHLGWDHLHEHDLPGVRWRGPAVLRGRYLFGWEYVRYWRDLHGLRWRRPAVLRGQRLLEQWQRVFGRRLRGLRRRRPGVLRQPNLHRGEHGLRSWRSRCRNLYLPGLRGKHPGLLCGEHLHRDRHPVLRHGRRHGDL